MNKLGKRLLLAGAAAFSIGLAGCGGSGSNGDSASDDQNGNGTATAAVRVVHAVADAPAVNVSLDRDGDGAAEEAFSALGFRETTALTEVESGTYDFAVDAILPDGSELEVLTGQVDLGAGGETTLVAAGSAEAQLSGGSPGLELIEVTPPDGAINQDCGAANPPCRARYNVVHAAAGVGPVDIFATTPDNASISGIPSIRLAFDDDQLDQQFSTALFADPGRRIRIVPASEDNIDDNVVFDTGSQLPAVAADEDVLAIAIDNVGTGAVDRTGADNPVRLLLIDGGSAGDIAVFRDKDAQPVVRAAHLSQDAGAVDITAGGQDVGLNDVPFTTVSGFLPVSETLRNSDGSLTVSLDTGGSPVSADLALTDGDFHTGYAVGLLGSSSPPLELISSSDAIRSVATEAQVRLVHAATQAGDVDVYVTPQGGQRTAPVLSGFAYKSVSPYTSLPVDLDSGTAYTFEVFSAGDDPAADTPVITTTETLEAGDVTTAIARDGETTLTEEASQFVDDAAEVETFK